ncbi:MAG: aminotransferase class I/II-fold pyridoxal phosphate-dependent enzyme [Bacteroidia bacterium]|nr:aminotransferase class I/II-fold pyridoxal phosphate-dependent enzyme [Bacteroidia bacterium]
MRVAVEESIFARMTALAQRYGAINLAQGLMWLDPDPLLLEISAQVMQNPQLHQYTSPAGELILRQAIAQISQHFFGVAYDPEQEITIVAGATEGIFTAILALTQPGQRAVFLEPAYDSYLANLHMANLQPHPVAMSIREEGVFMPWEEIEDTLSPPTSLLLLNFPHNPTGRVLSPRDINLLENLLERFPNVYVVVDEAYELMTWAKEWNREEWIPPTSVRQSPFLRERSVIVGSLGKMVGATGWRLGYLLAPASITQKLRAVHQFITFCAPTPLQHIVARYLFDKPERTLYFHSTLLSRRQTIIQALHNRTSLQYLVPEGSYFVLVRPPMYDHTPEVALAERWAQHIGVSVIPLSPFYSDKRSHGWFRLCFARAESMLEEAVSRLALHFPKSA